MESVSRREHTHIAYFNPDVETYNTAHQDLLFEFHAGDHFENFNDFIAQDAIEYAENGDGVTYLVWNILYAENGMELKYDMQICGIPALEIKMFAVNEKYQDMFYEYGGLDLPISAWVMRSIIDYANTLICGVLGFKAIFLHALPNAERFYENNGFHPVEINMQPLHCVDSDYKAMYL